MTRVLYSSVRGQCGDLHFPSENVSVELFSGVGSYQIGGTVELGRMVFRIWDEADFGSSRQGPWTRMSA